MNFPLFRQSEGRLNVPLVTTAWEQTWEHPSRPRPPRPPAAYGRPFATVNVYIGPLPRLRRGGRAVDVGARIWLWGDIDYGAVGHAKPGP